MIMERLCELKRTGEYRRLGHLFYTSRSTFLYDTGTGKVIKLDTDAQKVMECLFDEQTTEQDLRGLINNSSSIESIIEVIQKENLLCNPEVRNFVDLSSYYDSDVMQCEQLTIELTGNCNLRCKYCIYNDYYEGNRSFNTSNIDFETAKKAIDYVYSHSNKERMAITFYGGEPLLNFKVMKQCIDYCLSNIKHPNLYFSFTTNLTLMTEEIANYVAQIPNMSILLSLDGPEEIHNRARVNQTGKGSFSDAFNGLKLLANAINKYKKATIMFNAVLMPPYTTERFDLINKFFEGLDFLPDGTEVQATYPVTGSIPASYLKELEERGETNIEETTWMDWAKKEANGNLDFSKMQNLYSSLLRAGLTQIHNRPLYEKPMGRSHYNGCCIPGRRRLYVCTDGSYKVCERVGNAPSIGHVDTGIDAEIVKKYYLADYEKKSIPDCSHCWAINLCDICYAQCYDEKGLDITKKRKQCSSIKERYLEWLRDYYELVESQPELIKEVAKIEVT